jgi:hypothetical protein
VNGSKRCGAGTYWKGADFRAALARLVQEGRVLSSRKPARKEAVMSVAVVTPRRQRPSTTLIPNDRRLAEQLLREAAFVLHLTRRVKADLLASGPAAAPQAEGLLVGAGV